MGIISWIIFGLIAGALARLIHPGEDPGGCMVTPLIGIAGAVLGGMIGSFLGMGKVTGFNFGSFFIAVGGAVLLLFIYRKIKEKK